jgi:tripartite ATP-independent transporter DctM subunit
MEWWLVLLIFFSALGMLLILGFPVAFAFLLLNVLGVVWFWGGEAGLHQLILSLDSALTTFTLVPIVLFVFMGEVMFQSGVGVKAMDVIDKWLGRLPGRLALVAVAAGTLFSALSGSCMASTAMLGSVLTPQLEERGYSKSMSMGPLMGSGGIAMLIPPSALAVFLASIGEISVAGILMAGIVPGLLLACLYVIYIVVRCKLQPSIAPSYNVSPAPFVEKVWLAVRYVLPLMLVVFLVIGTIILGIATPSEAAALGALGSFFLAALYKGVNRKMMKKTFLGTLRVSIMLLMIIAGSTAFSQILSFSGASRGLVEVVSHLKVSPMTILIGMQMVILFLGCFMEPGSIIMITVPMFMLIVRALHLNPLWFGGLALINLQLGFMTPPFGLLLFTMKGVAPADTTMADVYRAGIPFLMIGLLMMVLIILFPGIVLWLPSLR